MSALRKSPKPKKPNSGNLGTGTKFPPNRIEPRLLLTGRTPILVPKFWSNAKPSAQNPATKVGEIFDVMGPYLAG